MMLPFLILFAFAFFKSCAAEGGSTPRVYCIENAAHYDSVPLRLRATLLVNDIDACNDLCRNTRRCRVWTSILGPGRRGCFLYKSTVRRDTRRNSVSGVMGCSTPAGTSVIQQGVAYRDGGKIGHYFVTNHHQCHKLCEHTNDCAFWTLFNGEGERDCNLSGSNATQHSDPNAMSGVMNRTTTQGDAKIIKGIKERSATSATLATKNLDGCYHLTVGSLVASLTLFWV